MTSVQAPARLHFGLFNLSAERHWAGSQEAAGIDARQFGGVGLMVEAPAVRLTAEPASGWVAEGLAADRVRDYLHRLAESSVKPGLLPHRVVVEKCPAEHAGLGTGTQLALAVARAVLSSQVGHDESVILSWACRLGRGRRSAIGIHGFLHGGFLVDGGKPIGSSSIAPLLVRKDFPESWRIVLAIPSALRGLHGPLEGDAFDRLLQLSTPSSTEALCRLVLLGMLPALVEQDCDVFGEAMFDFNRRVGEMFAPVQGGPYSHPLVGELVAFIRQLRVRGTGQSSWGPTVFAVVEDEDEGQRLARTIRQRFNLSDREVCCTRACNRGHQVVG